MMLNSGPKKLASFYRDERGFLLVVTMMILVVLTIIGMAALDTSMFEVRIASNDRLSKVAFNMADGSIFHTGKIITVAIEGGSDPSSVGADFDGFDIEKADGSTVAAPQDPDDFYKVIMGYIETKPERQKNGTAPFNTTDFNDPETNAGAVYVPDLVIDSPSGSAAVSIVGRSAEMIAGGGAEFGAGSAGAGVGAGGGGAAVTLDLEVAGYAGNNSRSLLGARYRKVLGAGGG